MKLEKIKLWSEKLGKFTLVQEQPQIRLFAEVLADFYRNAYRSTYSQREILDFLLDSPPH